MGIRDRVVSAARDIGSRAKDSVRRTVAPTDFERMAKIKSETARRKQQNERNEALTRAYEERQKERKRAEDIRRRMEKARQPVTQPRQSRMLQYSSGPSFGGYGGYELFGAPPEPRRRETRMDPFPQMDPGWNTIWDTPQAATPRRRERKSTRRRR